MATTHAISTVVTNFPGSFTRLVADVDRACGEAQETANINNCPCGIWRRDGWYAVCDLAPELIEPQPELFGWQLHAVVEPAAWDV
ncbi:MAG: hypothetical protein OEW98_00205 [Betaproteobacteria bacterium]|nr:hypothetical protein [Betaproteobacteria bacterium]